MGTGFPRYDGVVSGVPTSITPPWVPDQVRQVARNAAPSTFTRLPRLRSGTQALRPPRSPHRGYRIKSGKSQGTPRRALSLVFPDSDRGPRRYGLRGHPTMGTGSSPASRKGRRSVHFHSSSPTPVGDPGVTASAITSSWVPGVPGTTNLGTAANLPSNHQTNGKNRFLKELE